MKTSILLLNLGIGVIVFFSCTDKNTVLTEEYVIKVDSITLNSEIHAGQKIVVEFFGRIGENGCSSFSRSLIKSNSGKHSVTMIGKRKVGENQACPENLPLLNGTTIELLADTSGTYTLEIINPGIDQFIQKQVVVLP